MTIPISAIFYPKNEMQPRRREEREGKREEIREKFAWHLASRLTSRSSCLRGCIGFILSLPFSQRHIKRNRLIPADDLHRDFIARLAFGQRLAQVHQIFQFLIAELHQQ